VSAGKRKIRFFWIKNDRWEDPSCVLTALIDAFPLACELFFCRMLPAHGIYFELEPIKTPNSSS
jgi:hypothetical protein